MMNYQRLELLSGGHQSRWTPICWCAAQCGPLLLDHWVPFILLTNTAPMWMETAGFERADDEVLEMFPSLSLLFKVSNPLISFHYHFHGI